MERLKYDTLFVSVFIVAALSLFLLVIALIACRINKKLYLERRDRARVFQDYLLRIRDAFSNDLDTYPPYILRDVPDAVSRLISDYLEQRKQLASIKSKFEQIDSLLDEVHDGLAKEPSV